MVQNILFAHKAGANGEVAHAKEHGAEAKEGLFASDTEANVPKIVFVPYDSRINAEYGEFQFNCGVLIICFTAYVFYQSSKCFSLRSLCLLIASIKAKALADELPCNTTWAPPSMADLSADKASSLWPLLS